MLGTILFITRFDYDLQLTAIKSLGIGFKRILLSLSIAFFFLGSLICWFTNFLSPHFKKKCYDIFRNLDNLDPALNIKANVFINDIPNVGIYVGKKSGGTLGDIVVYTHDKNINSLFTAEKGTVKSDHSTKITSIELNEGRNYCEGEFFDKLVNINKKKNKIETRNKFKKQYVYVDMKDILTMQSFYESLSDIDSYRIFKLYKKRKELINESIDNIMDTIDKDYRYMFDEISEKKEIVLKNKIHESLIKNRFNNDVFDKADEIKDKNKDIFSEINDYQYDIRSYYIEFFKRNMTILGCFLMIIIGSYIGFLLRRGLMILPIIIGAFFVSLYFLGESLLLNFISINSYFFIFKKSGGCITMLIVIFLYILFNLLKSYIKNTKEKKRKNKAKIED